MRAAESLTPVMWPDTVKAFSPTAETAHHSCKYRKKGIRGWIEAHGAGGGRRLPSIRRLAATHNISRNAVIKAYERLVAAGWVRSKPGVGFYVADNAATLDTAS